MIKKTYVSFIFVLFGLFLCPKNTLAQSYDPYIWQFSKPTNIQNADDLKSNIESEVQKIIQAGHLAPFRAFYGENGPHYYWYHRYDTIYTLSAAYPYLNTSLQTQVKTYLQQEMSTYPLWSATYLDPKIGTKREADSITDSDRTSINYSAGRPRLFALYALWLYAHNTGDWTYIETNWTSIKNFYTSYSGETNQYYSSIAGAIGAARLAYEKPTKDTTFQNTVVSNLTGSTSGFASGKNFLTFAQNAENVFKLGFAGGDWTVWGRREIFLGFHFIDITPEIGRYFYDDATLKQTVIGTQTTFASGESGGGSGSYFQTPSEEYALHRGENIWPLWWMAQAPTWSRYFGEGSGMPLDAKSMIFPLKAWVQKEPVNKLRTYLDVPDALVGDYYYMQNVVRTIEASGTECWENITTTTQECVNSTVTTAPTPTVPLSPTPTPLNRPCTLLGDTNSCDGVVNALDFTYLSSKFGTNDPKADLKQDGIINVLDYSILSAQFGKTL